MSTDAIIEIVFKAVGGLGLLLLGLEFLSDGIQILAGSRMRSIIGKFVANRILATLTGTVVTAVMQSSTLVTVMIVGFVNSGILNLSQAIGLIMGANIGTTITNWILVLPIGKFGLPVLGVAALVYVSVKDERTRSIALTCLGLGMIFFGLDLMIGGFKPLRSDPELMSWFSKFPATTYVNIIQCAIVGAILAAIIHSSSATVVIAMGLAASGVIDFRTAAAVALGADAGTTVTSYLASLSLSRNAKRAAYFHILFNVIGVAFMIPIFPLVIDVMVMAMGVDPGAMVMRDNTPTFPYAMGAVAIFSTVFNVINTLILFPAVPLLVRLVTTLAPDSPADKEIGRAQYIFPDAIKDPGTALDLVEKEQRRYVQQLPTYMEHARGGATASISSPQLHTSLSALGKELESFLRDLAEKNLVAPQSATLMTLMHHQELIITLESNLYQLVKLVQAAPASDAMRQLTQTFVEALDVILYSTIDALDSQDPVDIDTLVLMTSDQGQVLEEMRHTYLQRESGFTSVEKASILLVSNIFERAVWITNQVGRLLRTVRERAAPSA